jgi:hypothetical protein
MPFKFKEGSNKDILVTDESNLKIQSFLDIYEFNNLDKDSNHFC